MKKIIFVFMPLLFLLSGCAELSATVTDQCLRKQIFDDCLKNLPAGQDGTKYSDWDEVVQACENVAYYQSMRLETSVKQECLSR